MELELMEEKRMFGSIEMSVLEPRPNERADVGIMPVGGIDAIMGGR
jgi:hypothetical protein